MKGEIFVCEECGYKTSKWMGKCPSCGSWDTLKSFKQDKKRIEIEKKFYSFKSVKIEKNIYIPTGIKEIDRVLGGGIVKGGLYLLGGDPGIGKTTLLLQIADKLSKRGERVLFVSAEESKEQLKIKAERIGVEGENIFVSQSSDCFTIKEEIKEISPFLAIIDSIQTVYNPENPSPPGSISQVRDTGAFFLRLSKEMEVSIFLIGHVTKTGEIAGPKTLEHMVDCVLYLEGEKKENLRILRPFKNRFGSTEETGIFEMKKQGILPIKDISRFFISGLELPGNIIFPLIEGKRVMLVEIQALVNKTFFPVPRRESQGYDIRRLQMIITVMEKYLSLPLYKYDVYINITGGIKIFDTACDLAILLSIISSFKNQKINGNTVCFGEIGLLGEIRNVKEAEKRILEAKKMGFKRAIVPYRAQIDNIEIIKAENIMELYRILF